MRYVSEERWASGWLADLEFVLVHEGEWFDSRAFPWLVERAGGWWTHNAADGCLAFVAGSYADLQRSASAAGWEIRVSPSRTAPDGSRPAATATTPVTARTTLDGTSLQEIAKRAWGARFTVTGLLGIAIASDVAGARLGLDEYSTVAIAAAAAALVLVPDPPLWRLPFRSRESDTD